MVEECKDDVRVEFVTETKLDKRSFTTFGLNAKPNTHSPIGFFGTGLKYAIAVLVRENIPIQIWVGHDCYEFYAKPGRYRDAAVTEIKCRYRRAGKDRPTYFKLPFTTDLGKTWDLWQAFRELHSNTLDEHGTTQLYNWTHYQGNAKKAFKARRDDHRTIIVVQGNRFAQTYHGRDSIFLKGGSNGDGYYDEHGVAVGPTMEVIDEPSQYLYYRGVRVYDLNTTNYAADRDEKPLRARYTYNILQPIDLTEDRTIKYLFLVSSMIGRYLLSEAPEDVVANILRLEAASPFWERKADFDVNVQPSSAVKRVYAASESVLPAVSSYWRTYVDPPKLPTWEGLSKEDTITQCQMHLAVCAEAERDLWRAILYHLGAESPAAEEPATDAPF